MLVMIAAQVSATRAYERFFAGRVRLRWRRLGLSCARHDVRRARDESEFLNVRISDVRSDTSRVESAVAPVAPRFAPKAPFRERQRGGVGQRGENGVAEKWGRT